MALKIKDLSGKKLSHRRSNFPSALGALRGNIKQRMLEFEPQQVIALAMGHANDLGPDILGALWNRGGRRQRGAGDFQRNLCCWPKRAVYGHECASCGDVQRRCKLQKVFAALITAADEYRNGKRQPYPLATLYTRLTLVQTSAPTSGYGNDLVAPMGPNDLHHSS